MTWELAMRYARTRARETGHRYRVYGYRARYDGQWAYSVGRA